ncbi:MBL fold metallo-hydrolase [Marinisporobacter balticus]|uniref:Glyoxylase-like metal-dependent hydrolase (Beta-lactamase superfamily II) n=1 Tax=Marinisporobacter balticus TaxID=2018667 RepID=A0A4V2SCL5_9FIRM|nr:MBL fold metallo-hydrolase [Marinisporobacter balticus]TCO79840.1 glyoxylase-like metal-dependent hydrolase (beta-lactamase superfamily II) [Marinisporobacter balticus]
MILERIPAGIYAVNCYILACEETKKACIIDPGGDADELLSYIEKKGLDLAFILLTHAHGDHIGGIPQIKEKENTPVFVHKEDEKMLQDGNKNLSNMMSGPNIEIVADRLLSDGEIIELGKLKLHIIHTPGHTRGSVCIKVEDMLFSGDTLFANSIGRTDLEGGSFEEIIHSIKRKLLIIEDEVKVLPGHGPYSSIGIERINNPFINQ